MFSSNSEEDQTKTTICDETLQYITIEKYEENNARRTFKIGIEYRLYYYYYCYYYNYYMNYDSTDTYHQVS